MRLRLRERGQDHLLQHLKELDEAEQADLFADLGSIDWDRLAKLWKEAKESLSASAEMKDDRLTPLDGSILGTTSENTEAVSQWRERGVLASWYLQDLIRLAVYRTPENI